MVLCNWFILTILSALIIIVFYCKKSIKKIINYSVLLSQDQPRPPVYNVEDYAGSLRKFGKRGPTSDVNNGDSREPKETEMTLKEFTSATELLEKLSSDLKLAYFR